MLFEQTLDGEETLDNALGVIHAVDTDAQEHVVRQLVDAEHLGTAKRDRQLVVRPFRRPLDRNRIRLDSRQIATVGNRRRFTLDSGLQKSIHRLDKILAMKSRVKAEDGTPQQARDQLFSPGADAERF